MAGTIASRTGTWIPDFPEDVFTFVRIKHHGDGYGRHKWKTDWPKAERNFTARLQQLTSIQVNPVYKVLEADDPELFNYPFAFISNPRNIELSDAEAEALSKYLGNGGFILVDDIWGDKMWDDISRAMAKVLPGRKPKDLDIDHPIFNAVFKLTEIPQVPSHDAAKHWIITGIDKHYEVTILQGGEEPEEALDTPHFRAWYDENGRMAVLVNHNNDIADGWEEEDYEPWFFKKYSEKYCFPIGINILFYALTN